MNLLANIFVTLGSGIVDVVLVGFMFLACGVLGGLTAEDIGVRSFGALYGWFGRGFLLGAIIGGGWSIWALINLTLGSAIFSMFGLLVLVAVVAVGVHWHYELRSYPASDID